VLDELEESFVVMLSLSVELLEHGFDDDCLPAA
jgi:hypothetical protein